MAQPMQTDADRHGGHDRRITFTVDGEPITIRMERITPNEILTKAGIDPATHYLVEIKGRHQTSYQGRGDTEIRVHDGDKFVSVSTGPTPTS
jgi:hypothetical protein